MLYCIRPTDERDINTTRCQWATFRGPAQAVLEDPGIEIIFGVPGEAQVGRGHTLEDVVIVLCRPEHGWRRVGHIPVTFVRDIEGTILSDLPCGVNIQGRQETNEGVSHLGTEILVHGTCV